MIGAVALAGCSSGDDSGGSLRGQTISYWSLWEANEPQAKVIKGAIASFTKSTGIKVDVQWQGRSLLQKVTPVLRSGDVPDLIDEGDTGIRAAVASKGMATDLSDVYSAKIPGEGTTVADAGPGKYLKGSSYDDKPFLLPYEVISFAVFYNGDALPEVAANPPKTWDDFTAVLDAQKAAGKQPLAVDGDIGDYAAYWLLDAVQADLGADQYYKLATDKSGKGWESAKVLPTIEKIEQLGKGGYFVDGSFGSKFPAVQSKWAAGDSDFLLMGSWAPSETAKNAADGMKYRAFPFPGFAEKGYMPANTIGFAIPKAAKHAEATKEFLKYFMKKDNIGKISSVALNLTPRPDVKAPEQLADVAKSLADAKTFVDPLDNVSRDFPTYQSEVFDPIAVQLLSGKITAKEFVAQIVPKQANYWETKG